MNFSTSDQHFGHKPVIEYCNRPFQSLEEMHEKIVSNWNSKVGTDDTVFVLGDFSFLKPVETTNVLQRLKGTKILIWGNHDPNYRNKSLRSGFSLVLDQAVLKLTKFIKVKLCHFPYAPSWLEAPSKKTDNRYLELRPMREQGMWLLHGHVHNQWRINEADQVINVGVDQWGFTPVSQDEIVSLISKACYKMFLQD